MTDRITKEHRSWNMSQIRAKNTHPELVLRSLLHKTGFRFRLHVRSLPGTPDIVLPKYHTVIFVHGCFWHRHAGCKYAYTPKSRIAFWEAKFKENIERQTKIVKELDNLGWTVLTVWECELEDVSSAEKVLLKNLTQISGQSAP